MGKGPFRCKRRGLLCFFFGGRGILKYIRRIFCGKKNSKNGRGCKFTLDFFENLCYHK